MSQSFPSQFEEDDPTLTDDLQTFFNSQDRILFLIDCGQDMYQADENGKIPNKVAFDCATSVYLNKVFSSETDESGIVLFGTASQNNVAGHDHVYVLQDLDVPSAARIKETEAFGSDGRRDVKSEFGVATEPFPLGNVFWTCMDLFAESVRKKRGTRRIFLITDQDNPHADNPSLRSAAIQRAKDLTEVGIQIELFGLNREGHFFDESLFYSEILSAYRPKDSDDEIEGGEIRASKGISNNLDELLERVRRRRAKKRSAFRIPLRLAEGLEIGVRGYNTIIEQGKGSHTWVFTGAEQFQEVESTTTYKCADTEQMLLPSEIKSYWPVAGGQSVFNKDERTKISGGSDPCIKLLGFMDRKALKEYHTMAHSVFIYPDESAYEGSTRTFAALLDSMLEQKRIGICVFTPRSNGSTLIAAMIPQKESKDDNGVQKQAPGIFLIRLPYADDIRDMPPATTARATDDQVEAAHRLLRSLYLDKRYDPSAYENPSLQLHYAVLQSLALDKKEEVEGVADETLPKPAVINERIKDSVPELEALLAADPDAVDGPSTSRKRKVRRSTIGP
ncbi:SPOC like C-terminal domain-containing protein [Fennellomyces sp. T-0311]|nr:SPOC like C-terminal domain-containing protein [Fennellomyces sp. T-0311]